MTDLSLPAIQAALHTHRLGHPAIYLPSVGSTNDIVHAQAEAGAAEGLLVLADEQTAGRGRLARTWWAPPGTCLLMSLLLRPPLPLRLAGQLPMCLGLGTAQGIEATTGLDVTLKWPNDVMYAGRKLGGMLTELSADGERLEYAVLGLGLNVNVTFDEPPGVESGEDAAQLPPPPDLAQSAVSLAMIAGRSVDRVALLAAILERCETWYERLLAGAWVHEAWAARLDTLGREVVVSQPDNRLEGTAVGVTPEGALVLRQADGREATIWAGDVTSLRPIP